MTATDQLSSELTPRIGKVARRALALNGFTTYQQLTRARPRDLLSIHGVGPKAIRILAEELADRGQSFRTDDEGNAGAAENPA